MPVGILKHALRPSTTAADVHANLVTDHGFHQEEKVGNNKGSQLC